jgi:hypothetical protein
MEQTNSELTGFTEEIEHLGQYYKVLIKYAFPLTAEERERYKIEDGEFFIELTDSTGTKSFRVFQDEDLEWKSDAASVLVDQNLIEVIGNCIDSKFE